MDAIYLLFLILPLALVYAMFRHRQSLAPGVLIILNMINLGLFLLYVFFENKDYIKANQLLYYFTIFIGVGILLGLILFPIFLILNFIYNGIVLLKREGFSLKNLLSIAMPILVILYVLLWPRFGASGYEKMSSILYNYAGILIAYLLLIASAYFFASGVNQLHPKKSGVGYIIVLGSGLINGDQVPPLLRGRIDKGIEVLRKNPKAILIMSGGKGKDEIISEAEAMRDYAISRQVDAESIWIENKSRSTEENIIFSRKLIDERQPKIAIVSSNYHVFRALLIANDLNIQAKGYGKTTKRYYAINAFIREIIGYVALERKKHINIFLILSAVYLLTIMLQIIMSAYQFNF